MKEERRAAAFLFHGIFARVELPRNVAKKSHARGGLTRDSVARIGTNAAAPHFPQFVGLCAVFSESAISWVRSKGYARSRAFPPNAVGALPHHCPLPTAYPQETRTRLRLSAGGVQQHTGRAVRHQGQAHGMATRPKAADAT